MKSSPYVSGYLEDVGMPDKQNTKTSKRDAKSPSFETFCENVRQLTKEDLRSHIVQKELADVAGNPAFPDGIRKLAADLVCDKHLLLPKKGAKA
ncbi:MAG: hypothetical protein JWM46_434 [Candidatus Kaiserbacteria bacterium]|nr:hypothetical protein [Candidatus Kaiserbacteria bacterium]